MVDPDIWLEHHLSDWRQPELRRLQRPKLDAMIDKQRAIFDDKQRKAAVKEIILYAIDHVPSCFYQPEATRSMQCGPAFRSYSPEHDLNGRQYEWIWLNRT